MPGDLQTLKTTINNIGNAPTPTAALQALLEVAIRLTRSEAGVIHLRDGLASGDPPVVRLRMGRPGFPETAPESIRHAFTTALDGEAPVALPPQPGWGAALCLPLLWGGQIAGVLYLERPAQAGAYTGDEQEIAAIFALQAALLLENQRLEAALRQESDAHAGYISTITHELRLPMTSIRGYADLLRQGLAGPLNEQQLHFVNVIANNLERMSTLVAYISDISRLQTNRLKLNTAAVSLRVSLDQALDGVSALLRDKTHTLERDLPGDLPPAWADPLRMTQVLAILLENACRYSPNESCIRVSTQQTGEQIFVSVKDDGIGVAPAERARLFEAFFRSEDERVREQPGWGLGLHVARRLVEAMGGKMGARFDDPPGSEFWFSLPAFTKQEASDG